ncbi:hypothetical protein OH76DRAFT_178824 [Lentinus brumalis]|uniref:Uncharacterized protein n=1 Tax=Lentinus brumalis TaxID=2498619 RepID=A0A371CNI1_9APHY|nr:hypothetical protein OH76DRAFT_178824 [Polyporus brumalis]
MLKAQRELVTSKTKIALHLFRGDYDGSPKPDPQFQVPGRGDTSPRYDVYTKPDSEAGPEVLSPYFADYLGDPKMPICETCAGIAPDYERWERIAAWKRLPKYAGIVR